MSNVKRGDVVVLVIGGKEYNALVHQVVVTEPSHTGENGEPALHLSYVPDDTIVNGKPKVWPIGHIPESAMLYSVVHASHKFSPEYMRSHGLKEVREHDVHRVSAEAEIRNRRGAGEWREKPSDTAFATLLEDNAKLRNELRDIREAAAGATGSIASVSGGPFTSPSVSIPIAPPHTPAEITAFQATAEPGQQSEPKE